MADLLNTKPIELGFAISKIDDERREVWGTATAEVLDKQGDIIDYDAAKDAFAAWPGNVREQHDTKKAIGKCIYWSGDDEKRAIWVGVRISKSRDGEDTWQKVKEGVLTGFSIKGMALPSRPEMVKSAEGSRTAN